MKFSVFAQRVLVGCLLLPAVGYVQGQTVRDDIGYTRLQGLLGSATPDGRGMNIGVIEPAFTHSGTTVGSWMPDTTRSDILISGTSRFDRSIVNGFGSPITSSHATQVAKWLYSSNASMAPAIESANFYHLGHFVNNFDGFKYQVNNFSAIGDLDKLNGKILRQFDWATDREDRVNVISAGNSTISPTIFGSSYNGIYVGITAGTSGRRTSQIDTLYKTRQRPDVVAPSRNTSRGTAVVSSVVTSLVQAAKNPALSTTVFSFGGKTTYHAERSEVIKAMVMAGADKKTTNTRLNTIPKDENGNVIRDDAGNEIAIPPSDIKNYRERNADRTDNGLDTRYGAGQVNIYNSYQILASGEQASQEDGGDETVKLFGFDYDKEFGLGIKSQSANRTASYRLPTLEMNAEFQVTLAWNLDVAYDDGEYRNALLYDFDLWIYEVVGDTKIFLDASTSSTANTENIWVPVLTQGKNYEFQVITQKNVRPLIWDYAIAWRTEYIDDGNSPDDLTADDLSSAAALPLAAVNAQAVPLPAAGWLFLSTLIGLFGLQHKRLGSQKIH